jgi:galactokinase
MAAIQSLREQVAEAERLHGKGCDSETPAPVRGIIEDARAVCLDSSAVGAYLSRASRLLASFSHAFPEAGDVFMLRAPGRVNLIGEHTDYNGLPVLPMAIDRDIMLAVAPRADGVVCIANTDARFAFRQFAIAEKIAPYPTGDWGNYAKAAVESLRDMFSDRPDNCLKGFNAVVDGNIPIAGGLSSSSALVVVFALAALAAGGEDMDRHRLAEALARGEQYVGTRGGGMDQTICLLAGEGNALKIEFFPVRTEHMRLPSTHAFVVCHSTVAAPKTSTARAAYNRRAAESRIAAAMLDRMLAGTRGVCRGTVTRIGDLYSEALALSEAEIDSIVEQSFRKDEYSLREVALALDMDEESVCRAYGDVCDANRDGKSGSLMLRRRCRHILSEGRRVRRAAKALQAGRAEEFGALMYESHESCARDYEVSIPALDALVEIARDAGAVGSRLTGAGFGGCTVSLVANGDVAGFIEAVEKCYFGEYLRGGGDKGSSVLSPSERIFVCRAVRGAGALFDTGLSRSP